MALRPERNEHLTDLSFFMNEAAERGGIVILSSAGSGSAMDDANASVRLPVVDAPADLSGSPIGLLLNDVVNLDLTKQHINYAKDEMQLGGKVLLLRRGTVTTDQVSGTPVGGSAAYYFGGGVIIGSDTSQPITGAQVGQFLSSKDADGFCKVSIDIR